MTPEQALKLLDSLVAGITMSRQQHAQVIVAVSVLAGAIAPVVGPVDQADGAK